MNLDRYTKVFIALFVALFVALVFSQADKKFVLDELDFPIVAKATSETLRPVYYRGEGHEEHLGLYHPPLYIYALSAHIKFFGFSENTVRSFGLLSVLITAFLTAILAGKISSTRSSLLLPIFVGIYLTNPYTIANATLPDIDQTILPPLIVLYLIFLLGNGRDWILAVAFTFLLWAKLTTPLALIPFSMLYWYFGNRSIDETLSRCIRVFGGAIILFLCSYLIYCKLTNLPFGYTIDFLLHSFSKGTGASDYLDVYQKIIKNYEYSIGFLEWVMYPYVLLFFISMILTLQDCRSNPEAWKILGLGVLTILVTLFYCGLIAPFGGFFKYPFPVFQLACLVISIIIASQIQNGILNIRWFVALGGVVALLSLAFQQEYLGDHRSVANFIVAGFVESEAPIVFLFIVAGLFSILSRNVSAIILTIIVGCQVGLAVGVSRNHAVSLYPTKYNYGQRGFNDTVDYLKQRLKPGEVIWAMKDIGYYTGNKYVESYPYYFDNNVESKIESLVASRVRYFVATRDIGEDRLDAYPRVLKSLNACCLLEKNFGNYYIYRNQ